MRIPIVLRYHCLMPVFFRRLWRLDSHHRRACDFLVALAVWPLGVAGMAAAAGCLSTGSRQQSRSSEQAAHVQELVVEVVDEKGTPVEGAVVEGLVEYNPGPAASTCCTTKSFAKGVTGKNGRVALAGPPPTFRPMHLMVSFRDWPFHEETFGSPFDRFYRLAIGLPRDVSRCTCRRSV